MLRKIFLSILSLAFWQCSQSGFFDLLGASTHITMLWDIHNADSSITQGTPTDISTEIYHLELLNSPDDPTPYVVIDAEKNPNVQLEQNLLIDIGDRDNFHDLPEGQKNEALFNIFSDVRAHPTKAVRYTKIYYSAFHFLIPLTNFNNSNQTRFVENLYLFLNRSRVDGLIFDTRDQGALNRQSTPLQVQFVDKSRSTNSPLGALTNKSNRLNQTISRLRSNDESNFSVGQDNLGLYVLAQTNEYALGSGESLHIKIELDLTNTFNWIDDRTSVGVFDAAAFDIFTWWFVIPNHQVTLGKL